MFDIIHFSELQNIVFIHKGNKRRIGTINKVTGNISFIDGYEDIITMEEMLKIKNKKQEVTND